MLCVCEREYMLCVCVPVGTRKGLDVLELELELQA